MSETLYELLRKIRYDATAIQGKVTDALNMLAALNLPDESRLRCPREGCPLAFAGPATLAEHVYNSHGGPVPAHYERIEALSEDTQ
jgi:hypothetical protein